MKIKLLFVLLVGLMLTGCFETLKPTVYVNKFNYVRPPAAMLKDCVATAPPTKALYLAATPSKKEEHLFDYSNSLLTDISVCNIQWDELRKWNDKQEKIYSMTKP